MARGSLWLTVLALCLLLVGGCGKDESSSSTPVSQAGTPESGDQQNGDQQNNPAPAGASGTGGGGAGGTSDGGSGFGVGPPPKSDPPSDGGGTGGGATTDRSPSGTGGSTARAPAGDGNPFVTSDHIAAIVLRPRSLLQAPVLQAVPRDLLFGEMISETGIDPADLEEVTILIKSSMIPNPTAAPAGPTSPMVVFRFADAVNGKELAAKMFREDVAERKEGGKVFYVPSSFEGDSATGTYQVDANTIVAGEVPELRTLINGGGGGGALSAELKRLGTDDDVLAVFVLEPVKNQLTALASMVPPGEVPPQLAGLTDLPQLAKSVVLRANVKGGSLAKIEFNAYDAGSAGKIEAMTSGGIDFGKQMFAQTRDELSGRLGQMLGPEITDPMLKLADDFLNGISVSQTAQTVVIDLKTPASLAATAASIGPKLAEMAGDAATSAQRSNNLKQIALAMHIYHDVYTHFPPAGSKSDDGKPLLSWRVHLLPFLEHEDLYDRFKLDEPWDSPNNKPLMAEMPDVFLTPGDDNNGTTRVMVLLGDKTPFGNNRELSFRDILDGSANTLMFVETGSDKAVEWTKPADTDYDESDPLACLGNVADQGGFYMARMDGSVEMVPLDPELIRAMAIHNDRKVPEF